MEIVIREENLFCKYRKGKNLLRAGSLNRQGVEIQSRGPVSSVKTWVGLEVWTQEAKLSC